MIEVYNYHPIRYFSICFVWKLLFYDYVLNIITLWLALIDYVVDLRIFIKYFQYNYYLVKLEIWLNHSWLMGS